MPEAGQITENMKIAAAKAIAGIISDEELNEEYIIPGAFDERVCDAVARAVAERKQKIRKIVYDFKTQDGVKCVILNILVRINRV